METEIIEKNKIVPNLRFKEFHEDWKKLKLEKTIKSISSGKTKPEENGFYPVYGSTGIIGKTENYSHDGEYVLIARVGANAGTINRIKSKFAVTDNTLILITDLDQLLPRFAELFLIQFKLNRLIFGSGQPLITGGLIKALKILLPSLPEQQKIATFLSSVDKKIQQLLCKKELLETYKKGVMQQLFSQRLRFKPALIGAEGDENGKDFPDWEVKRLGEICTNISYGMNAAATTYDGQNKYLRITDIDDSSDGLNVDKLTSPNGILEDKFRVKPGDLLFARTGASVGKSYLYRVSDGILYFAGFLIRFHVNVAVPAFIYLQTQTIKYDKWVKVMSMRSGQPGINAEEYKTFEISFPCIAEQQKIADFLSGIDIKIEAVSQQITKTQSFKKGLLQQMFV